MTGMHQLIRDVFGDIYCNPKSKVGKSEYKDNFTLIGASYCGDIDIITDLLKKGIDINFADDYGRTALYFACYQGQTQVVKMLLESGADKDIKDCKKRTPLDIAQKYEYQEIVALLTAPKVQTASVKIASQNQMRQHNHINSRS